MLANKSTQITALIVTYNEDRYLDACLKNLAELDELIVVDMGSHDKTLDIARRYADKVLSIERVEIVEEIWPQVVSHCSNDWILRPDPDEIYPLHLFENIYEFFANEKTSSGTCQVRLPLRNHFRESPLESTVWSGVKYIPKLFHRERVTFTSNVHQGLKCLDTYSVSTIESDGANEVIHYWINSYREFFEKHKRYLKKERESLSRQNETFSRTKQWYHTLKGLFVSLIIYKGIIGGRHGIQLSFLYGWYQFRKWQSLKTTACCNEKE
jgi:glycosyltransferase involved in cell wall biosynthesis